MSKTIQTPAEEMTMGTTTNQTLFAAIGTDGLREVVWGVGDTAEAAEADALEQAAESDCDPALVRTVAITPEQAARIDAGTVAAAELGL